ncbi:N-acyl-L-amino acid amidohydrolase [Klebsiella pneumoniae]|uniref:N-acyl-L-amino acid amidohydrolase n=1 Tax=Klebsiella pneumoniae TaxID=573 RepID=A0A378AFC3_KLEPN|nr:N-acyl-L-amino acid amidohydrolase [Klebsiella pneumoniae]
MNQQQLKQQLIAWRHYLHAHPESAFEEQNTSRFIAEKLEAMGIEVHRDIGKTGGGGEIEMRRREGRYRYSCRYRCHSIDRTGRLVLPLHDRRADARLRT